MSRAPAHERRNRATWSSSRKKRPFQTDTVSYTASPRVNPRSKSGIRASWAAKYSPSMNATPSAMPLLPSR